MSRPYSGTVSLEECANQQDGSYREDFSSLIPAIPALTATSPEHAALLVKQKGIAVIRKGIPEALCKRLQAACHREAQLIWSAPGGDLGNRNHCGPAYGFCLGRYSFGVASNTRQLFHLAEWQDLAALPCIQEVASKVLSDDFLWAGAGGDFVLGRTLEAQALHSDHFSGVWQYDSSLPPLLSCAAVIEPITALNGPLRVLPGTHLPPAGLDPGHYAPPYRHQETEQQINSVLAPLDIGDLIVRDTRTFHSGTQNWTLSPRYLPAVEFTAKCNEGWGKRKPALSQKEVDELPACLKDRMDPKNIGDVPLYGYLPGLGRVPEGQEDTRWKGLWGRQWKGVPRLLPSKGERPPPCRPLSLPS